MIIRKKLFSMIFAVVICVSLWSVRAPASLSSKCYQQGDLNWAFEEYGKWNILQSGCGILAAVNAVNYLTGNFIEPQKLAEWAYENDFYNGSGGQGTMRWGFYANITDAFGAEYGFSIFGLKDGDIQNDLLIKHLENGGAAIVHVPNHFMAINAYDSSAGRYLVYDSAADVKRNTTTLGAWLTAEEMNANKLTVVDWFCLVSKIETDRSKN